MAIKVKGVQQTIRNLRIFEKQLVAGIFDGVLEAARPIAIEIRNRTPKGPTGNARRSIKVGKLKSRFGKNVAAYVRVDHRIAPHFHFHEFGTVKQKPTPSFRPVVDQVNSSTFAPVTAAGKRALNRLRP